MHESLQEKSPQNKLSIHFISYCQVEASVTTVIKSVINVQSNAVVDLTLIIFNLYPGSIVVSIYFIYIRSFKGFCTILDHK